MDFWIFRELRFHLNVDLNLDVILIKELNFVKSNSNSSFLIKFKSIETNNCDSISYMEPMAISKNLLNSLLDFLEHPSAMLLGTDTEALLNWDDKPNFSDSGKFNVVLYTSIQKDLLNFHISKSLNLCILQYFEALDFEVGWNFDFQCAKNPRIQEA